MYLGMDKDSYNSANMCLLTSISSAAIYPEKKVRLRGRNLEGGGSLILVALTCAYYSLVLVGTSKWEQYLEANHWSQI